MTVRNFLSISILCLCTLMSFAQSNEKEPHKYGGWYCPDNLNGFPAVDIKDWESVPVVNGRMATMEETRNGTSLIFVDMEKYPNAKPLDMKMPKLARYYNRQSGKKEIIIVIQAVNISNDSIVGFRYLNGGNGSARLNEVSILSDSEIEKISPSRFVSLNLTVDATKEDIWKVLTGPDHSKTLQAFFDKENKLNADWHKSSEVNFNYPKRGKVTSAFAGELWGAQYIQIDCVGDDFQYVEKFLLLSNKETKATDFKITCGPYGDDYEKQRDILKKWAEKVKELSEKI